MVSFESFKKIFDRFITKYRRPTLEYWVKTLTSTLDHRVVFNFFVQARTSPMETKRSLKKPEMANMCLFFLYKSKVFIWNQRFKYGRTDSLSTLTPMQPGSCTYAFRFIFLSKVDTAWSEIFGQKCSTISQKRHYTI